MMRPTIDQIIQYVRDGETDKHIAQLIEDDPRGEQKLSQARFICELIGRQKARPPAEDSDWSLADALGEPLIAANRMQSVESSHELPEEAVMNLRLSRSTADESRAPEIHRLVSHSIEGPNVLGTLIATDYGDHVEFSFESPEPRPPVEADSDGPGESERTTAMSDVGRSDRISIEGADYTLMLQKRLQPGEPVQLEFQRAEASRGFEILYMPDTGPFERITPNQNGIVILNDVPKRGLLRISGRGIDVLRMENEKISPNS